MLAVAPRISIIAVFIVGVFIPAPQSVVHAAPLSAGSITVTTTIDEYNTNLSACSLREAITAANTDTAFGGCPAGSGLDTIILPAGIYQLTIPNTSNINEDNNASGDLDITSSMVITGANQATTFIQAGSNISDGIDKVFAINPICTSAVSVTIQNVTIRYGRNTQPFGATDYSFTGGGLDYCSNVSGDLNLDHVTVSDNNNVYGPGGGLNVDTYTWTGTIRITNSSFTNNHTLSTARQVNGGGINIMNYSPAVIITDSTFTNNSTPDGGSSNGGAVSFSPGHGGSLSVSGSTFTSNSTGNSGTGVGGAIYMNTSYTIAPSTITNSAFSGNRANSGGAIYMESLGTFSTTITDGLFENNQASVRGGGIYVAGVNMVMHDSRLVGNTAANAASGTGLFRGATNGSVDVTDNWWGCSTGPSAAPCNTAINGSTGTLTISPWLQDTLSSSLGLALSTNQQTTLTASFTTNSSGSPIDTANLGRIIGQTVAWNATAGTLTPTHTTIQDTGQALATYRAISPGSVILYARVDNDNMSGTSPNVLSIDVYAAMTTTTITSDLSTPTGVGEAVTVAVAVAGNYGNSPTAPTGTIDVSDGVATCTITLPNTSCDLTLSTAGNHTINAVYNGDANFFSSASANVSHPVGYPTTTSITSDPTDPSVVGQPVVVNYSVTSAQPGTITGYVTVSDGVDSCMASVAAGTCNLTLTTPGSRTLTASYSGDSSYSASTSTGESHTVSQASTTTTLSNDTPDPSVYGQSVTFTFSVSVVAPGAGTPTGSVTVGDGSVSCTAAVADGSCTIAAIDPGTTNFTAVYSGDAHFTGSTSAAVDHTVTAATTNTSITGDSPDPSTVGQAVAVNYSVSVVSPGTGTPTGNVTVSDGTDSCTASVADGTCNIAFTTIGSHTLTAVYAGDTGNNSSSSSPVGHTVSMASTTIAITTDIPDPSVAGVALPVYFSVVVVPPGAGTPTGNVTITDGVDTCTVPVATGVCSLTLTTVGGRFLTATYSGDTNFGSCTSIPEPHIVQGPPHVSLINSVADTGDGQLSEGEFTSAGILQLLVTFNKDMNALDAATTGNYHLVLDGSTIDLVNGVTYNNVTFTSTLNINGGVPLPEGHYTLTISGVLRDTLGAPIGTDFIRHFTIDSAPPNVLSNGIIDPLSGTSLVDGGIYLNRFTTLQVNFNENVSNESGGSSISDVTNPSNYLLLQTGPDGEYDTTDCFAFADNGSSPLDDDVRIPTGPVSYSNGSGTGPFVATLTLNGGTPLPYGEYLLLVCGTTSITDMAGNHLNGGADTRLNFTLTEPEDIPDTGFAQDGVTDLPERTTTYTQSSFWLEIPRLGVQMDIVGVPLSADGAWDTSWLGGDAGWLAGTAYPTWNGNSVLTGHVWNADNTPGPFRYLSTLRYGDQVIIHEGGAVYVYEIRSITQVSPTNTTQMLSHENYSWLTLVTCSGYNEASDSYRFRVLVRAVLIDVH
jgi:LPXTG-site transpeptidase (sortase) family protein